MTSIYKYKLSQNQETQVDLPKGAKPLKVDVQHGSIFLWAIVDTDAEEETRTFEVFGTGHFMKPAERNYINTFFVDGGTYVFHAFERT